MNLSILCGGASCAPSVDLGGAHGIYHMELRDEVGPGTFGWGKP